jgi:hemolysin D
MKSSLLLSEQPVLLEKPAIWYRLFIWMLMLMTASGFVWAYFARIEQAVPASGMLELTDGSKEIQAPSFAGANFGTVVRLHVEDGDRVEKNQPILTFSPTAPGADLDSLKKSKDALESENKFYDGVVSGKGGTSSKAELDNLIKEREARLAENLTFEALINELYFNRGGGAPLNSNQQALYSNYRAEYLSRVATAQGQVQELEKQLKQAADAENSARKQVDVSKEQLDFAKNQLTVSQNQLSFAENQLMLSEQQLEYAKNQLKYAEEQLQSTKDQIGLDEGQLDKSKDVLSSNKQILGNMEPLGDSGAISQLQIEQQKQQVLRGETEVLKQQQQIKSRESDITSRQGDINARQADLNTRQGDINSRRGELNSRKGELNSRQSEIKAREGEILKNQAEVDRQVLEQQRIQESISRAQEQLKNTKDAWAKDLYTRIADNKKALAVLDSQLSRYKLENDKRLTDINGQITKTQQSRDAQVLKAPVSGVIFDMKPSKKEKSKLEMKSDTVCQYVINSVLKAGEPKPKRCEDAYYEAQQGEKILKILSDENGLQATVYLENKNMALVLDALRMKREKLEKYHGKELAGGDKIECEKGKSCSCPYPSSDPKKTQKSQEDLEKKYKENLDKLGLTEQDCLPVEVQVEAFPSVEYGTIPGEVIDIGKDAIEPTQLRQFYSFKTTIKLHRQYFVVDKEKDIQVRLQPGMGIAANINIGKRSVLDLFVSRFTGKLDSVKRVR